MATDSNLETLRKKEIDLAIAFFILDVTFFFVSFFKGNTNAEYIREVTQLREVLTPIIIKP
jgi:hypothetical protein